MSFGKSSGNQSSQENLNQTQNQSQTQNEGQQEVQNQNQTQTPNNLPLLQQVWGMISGLTGNTNGSSTTNANNGLALTANGANATSNAATGGLNTATGIANNGAVNPANAYLTPFANGSLSGNNPYMQNLVQQITQQAQGATDGTFAASGRYGSGANANAFNSAVANETGQLGYANYGDSLNRQLQAGQQLSTNGSTSIQQQLQALGIIPQLGTAAQGAGTTLYGAGVAPTSTMADILALLGQGGGTASGSASGSGIGTGTASGSSSGNTNGTSSGSSSSTNFGLNLGNLIKPFALFGNG